MCRVAQKQWGYEQDLYLPRARARPRPRPRPRALPLADVFICAPLNWGWVSEVNCCSGDERELCFFFCCEGDVCAEPFWANDPVFVDGSQSRSSEPTFGVGGGVNPPKVISSCLISSSFSPSIFPSAFFIAAFQLPVDTNVHALLMSCDFAMFWSRIIQTTSGSWDSSARYRTEVDLGVL